jgi:hypothetical protein
LASGALSAVHDTHGRRVLALALAAMVLLLAAFVALGVLLALGA